MKSVEDLDLFKLAPQLAIHVFEVTQGFPKDETFLVESNAKSVVCRRYEFVQRRDAAER